MLASGNGPSSEDVFIPVTALFWTFFPGAFVGLAVRALRAHLGEERLAR